MSASLRKDMDMIVRDIETKDLGAVLEMIHALAAHHGDTAIATMADLRRDAFGWAVMLVAEVDGDVVGYAGLVPMVQLQFGVRGMDLHHLFVQPSQRQTGLGRALVQACAEKARNLECRFLTVGTAPANIAAQKMYLQMGFEERPTSGPRFRILL